MPRTRATVWRWRASNATRTVPRLSALVDSVIVPTYNEAASLPLLVERLAPAMRDRGWGRSDDGLAAAPPRRVAGGLHARPRACPGAGRDERLLRGATLGHRRRAAERDRFQDRPRGDRTGEGPPDR